jgi:hypothetical protein
LEIYLPIAGIEINIFYIILLGIVVGFLSGLMGIGGGIILNPALIKLGIPPIVTVGTSVAQMVGATVSGFLAHLRLKNIDLKMGWIMVLSGFIGGGFGVFLTKILEDAGYFRTFVLSLYTFYLGFTGLTMFIDVLRKEKKEGNSKLKDLIESLPFKMKFQFTEVSVLVPVGIGAFAGFLAAVMGVGGGFVIIPALIYLANFPVQKAVGMSLFQMIFITGFLSYFHSVVNHGVDVILAALLMAGSSFGAVFGTAVGQKISKEKLKFIMALLVSSVAVMSFYQLFFEKPKERVPLMENLDNPISKFAFENPNLYAILVIIFSVVFGFIISSITHRLKVYIEIQLEKRRHKNA